MDGVFARSKGFLTKRQSVQLLQCVTRLSVLAAFIVLQSWTPFLGVLTNPDTSATPFFLIRFYRSSTNATFGVRRGWR